MIRAALAAPLTLLLLTAPAFADADESTPLEPKSEAPAGLEVDDLELLPLDQTRRQLLALKNQTAWDTVHWLGGKRRRAAQQLAQRKNRHDAKSKQLRAEIAKLDLRLKPHLAALREAIREHGVGDDQLATLKRLKPPLGPRRDYRYAHRLVVSVPGLSRDAKRCARVTSIVHGLDGAQLAMLSQRRAIEATLREASQKLAAPEKRRLQRLMIRTLERQVGRMERRFWKLVDALLTDAEKGWVRRMLPHRLTRLSDPLGHIFRIPGLKPGQAARIRALLAELESEATADQAQMRRLQRKLRSLRKRPWPEQKVVRDEYRKVQLRVVELTLRIQKAGRKVLTPSQYAYLQAIPPQLNPRDRNQPLRRLLDKTPLSLEQRERVAAIQRRVAAGRRAAYAEAGRVNRMGSNFGPDSPQQMKMQMMRLGMENEARGVLTQGVYEVFLEVLSPQQVVGWLVSGDR